MVNGIRTIHSQGLNKSFSSKFCLDSRVQHETTEEDKSNETLGA